MRLHICMFASPPGHILGSVNLRKTPLWHCRSIFYLTTIASSDSGFVGLTYEPSWTSAMNPLLSYPPLDAILLCLDHPPCPAPLLAGSRNYSPVWAGKPPVGFQNAWTAAVFFKLKKLSENKPECLEDSSLLM